MRVLIGILSIITSLLWVGCSLGGAVSALEGGWAEAVGLGMLAVLFWGVTQILDSVEIQMRREEYASKRKNQES